MELAGQGDSTSMTTENGVKPTTPHPGIDSPDAVARRRAEAIDGFDEAIAEERQEELKDSPIPIEGLTRGALALLKQNDCDYRSSLIHLRAVANGHEWQRLDATERAVTAAWMRRELAGSAWLVAIGQIFGNTDRTGSKWIDAPVVTATAASGPPWTALDVVEGDGVPPWQGIGRGLAIFGPAAVTSITGASKQGKSTAIWTDLAPFTWHGKVLAVVGASERGPGGWADYARMIHALGGNVRNVVRMDPPASLDAIAEHLPESGIGAVVLDSASSLMAGLGANENVAGEVREVIDGLRAWNVPCSILRHNVNAGSNPMLRDRDASRGAGSRDWRAAVDAEATFTRDGNVSRLAWVGRDGCPAVTGFQLDKTTWPYGVEVLDADTLGGGGDDPGAGNGPPPGPTSVDAEQAVLDALDGTTEADPWIMSALERAVASKLGTTAGKRGRWWRPYREAVDRLFARGDVGANRDPSERRSGRTIHLWKACGKPDLAPLAPLAPGTSGARSSLSEGQPCAKTCAYDVVIGAQVAQGSDADPEATSKGDETAESERPAMDDVPDDRPLVSGDTIALPRRPRKPAAVLSMDDWRACHFPPGDGWRRVQRPTDYDRRTAS